MDAGRVITAQELEEAAQGYRDRGFRTVFTNGCFDLLHPGHLAILQFAAALGDVLIVGVNDDASVARLKGPRRPVYPAAERAEILLGLRGVDAVTVFSEDTPLETIHRIRPDVLVKGAEYGDGEIVGEKFVVENGGRVERFPMREGYATSKLIDRVRDAQENNKE